MSLIAKELVKHEKIFEFTSLYEDYLRQNTDRKIWLVNTNKLVKFYDGVDGLKTGFTDGAGYCITATAKRDGLRIIAVVMGEPTSKMRNKEISEMFDYSFAQYNMKRILNSNTIGKYKVEGGKEEYINVDVKEPASVLVRKGEDVKEYSYDVFVDDLKAPLKKNKTVGKLNIRKGKELVRTIDLIVSKNIPKINILELFLRNMKNIIAGNINLE